MPKQTSEKPSDAGLSAADRDFDLEAVLLAEAREDMRANRFIDDDAADDWLDGLCRGEEVLRVFSPFQSRDRL